MDVAIISCHECFFSQNAEAHVKGFFERMISPDNKKMEITVQSYDLRDIDHNAVAAEVHQAKVQIVIVSHHFLERLKHEATTRKKMSPINRVLRSKRVISILLSMSSQEIIEGYQLVLARFHEWFSVELRSTSKLDPEFCRKFTEQVVRIYNVELTNTSNFTVFPKKVTKDQQKVAIILKKPMGNKAELRVELTRGRDTQVLDANFTSNPYTAIIRIPDCLCCDRQAFIEITVYINQQKLGTKVIKYDLSAKNIDEDSIERMTRTVPGFLKLLDDHISQILSRHLLSGTNYSSDSALELMNDVLLSRSEEFPGVMHFSAYYGLEQTVWALLDNGDGLAQCAYKNINGKTPADFAQEQGHTKILETINNYQEVTNTWEAIQYMKDLYNKTNDIEIIDLVDSKSSNEDQQEIVGEVSSGTSAEVDAPQVVTIDCTQMNGEHPYIQEVESQCSSEIPVQQLLEAPKPNVRNIKQKGDYINFLPNEPVSQSSGPEETDENPESPVPEKPPRADTSKVKPITASPLQNYDVPRLIAEDYSIPPNPRPIPTESSPILSKKRDVSIHSPNGYIIMEPDESRTAEANTENEPRLPPTPEERSTPLEYPSPILRNPHKDPDQLRLKRQSPTQRRSPSKASSPCPGVFDPAEEALIDLMNDFKNNVYNIRQLELLFENWKGRSDVQRSFEEKQIDLQKMREDYNRIQAETIKNNRKMSALDRIKKFFPGAKKKMSNTGLSNSVGDMSSRNGSTGQLHRDEFVPTPQPNFHTLGLSADGHKHAADRGSLESGGSAGSAAEPDSGVDSDKDKDNKDCVNNTEMWTAVLTKRFIASYIGPNPLPLSVTDPTPEDRDTDYKEPNPIPIPVQAQVEDAELPKDEENFSSYQVPPMPRPVAKKPIPKPYPITYVPEPMEPLKVNPPPPPKKKFSLRSGSKDGHSPPPPPPPRSFKSPNVFNYVDYQNKKRDGEKPQLKPQPYENTRKKTPPK